MYIFFMISLWAFSGAGWTCLRLESRWTGWILWSVHLQYPVITINYECCMKNVLMLMSIVYLHYLLNLINGNREKFQVIYPGQSLCMEALIDRRTLDGIVNPRTNNNRSNIFQNSYQLKLSAVLNKLLLNLFFSLLNNFTVLFFHLIFAKLAAL